MSWTILYLLELKAMFAARSSWNAWHGFATAVSLGGNLVLDRELAEPAIVIKGQMRRWPSSGDA
jgi:hypothetical protein